MAQSLCVRRYPWTIMKRWLFQPSAFPLQGYLDQISRFRCPPQGSIDLRQDFLAVRDMFFPGYGAIVLPKALQCGYEFVVALACPPPQLLKFFFHRLLSIKKEAVCCWFFGHRFPTGMGFEMTLLQ
jgi:hypothetical protein